jgi:hypothetical protein
VEPPAEPDRKRFPLLDSEEPPRSWRRRLAIPAAVIVVVILAAGGFALVRSLTHKALSSTALPPTVSALGRIAVITKDQNLVVSRPNGTHIVKIPSLDQPGQFVTPALDNRYLSLGDGEVAAATGRLPAVIHTKIYPFANGMQAANGAPFADHDQELLALTPNNYGPYTDNQASEISLATGRSTSFGTADTIAGDPQARGMFVSVGARVPLADQTRNQNLPDARVELRDARRPTVLLATAGMLNRDLGQPAGLRVSLYPEPNPAGSAVAVEVAPVSGGRGAGIVVLSRTGRVLGVVPASKGTDSGLSWSPSGGSLAFPASGGHGAALSIWSPGGQIRSLPFPGGAGYDLCLWSPDGKWILCAAPADQKPTTVFSRWVIGKAAGGPMTKVTGPGTPVTWLP